MIWTTTMNGHGSNVVQNFILAAAEQHFDFPEATAEIERFPDNDTAI